MQIIGIVKQKGGTGASTLARMVAVNYAAAEWKVKIADMDLKQGTSTRWNARRMENDFTPLVNVEQYRSAKQAIQASSAFYDLLVFDGMPHSTKQTLEIAAAADMAIIPTGTAIDDLEPTVLLANEMVAFGIDKNKICIAFSRVGTSTPEYQEARDYLGKTNYHILSGAIFEKTAVRRAQDAGKCATETPYKSVNNSADELLQSIVDKLNELAK